MTNQYLACTDCVHAVQGGVVNTFLARVTGARHGWQCRRVPLPSEFNRVTGTQEPDQYQMCSVERGKYGECSENALHWTPRRRQDLFRLLSRP
jgi:hypothetical protein